MRTVRHLVAVAVTALCAVGFLVAPVSGEQPVDVATAADTRLFDPGNIITDQLFFNGTAMTAAEVQTFLNVTNPDCVPSSSGVPCLKNYRQSTWTRPADSSCPNTYVGAANETAATIIAKVGQACGISQRVLLVLLQKEQGLVTASGNNLTTTRYQKATGYACPDTAACDSAYFGFFNQLYSAASRYKTYAANPTRYNHRAGQVNNIRYDVELSCGSSPVFIRNQATAGLYNYTPYQPNAAALAAGKGTGDSCSAYGNRNFWIFFTDWFGSTQTPGAGDLVDFYNLTGGERGPLGPVTHAVSCGLAGGGCKQGYANGWIYWSPSTGARSMQGAVSTMYELVGAERSPLGYPRQSVSWGADHVGQYALFQNGAIYWHPSTGARSMQGEIGTFYAKVGAETSPLGYPTQSVSWGVDGVGQYALFQNGAIYWSPSTGAKSMQGAIGDFYRLVGAEGSPLGYPTQSVSWLADKVGQYATFANGAIYWSPTTGARTMMGPIGERFAAEGAETGPLGYPTLSVSWLPDGVGQYATFQNGRIFWSPTTGAHAMTGAVGTAYANAGAESGPLGYPTEGVTVLPDGVGQSATFQHGTIVWHPSTGARVMQGAVGIFYAKVGGAGGPLGYPTSDVQAGADGTGQYAEFQNGSIYWSPSTGTRSLQGAIGELYQDLGAEGGDLGYPTRSVAWLPDRVGQYATFENGTILWSPTTGARVVRGPVGDFYAQVGAEAGPLGYPTADVTASVDGVGQYGTFQNGSIYWSPATGARSMQGAIGTLYRNAGAERSPLGYPTRSVSWLADKVGQYATFQNGSIYWSPATGARSMQGAIGTFYGQVGAERSPLGYPTQSVSWGADGVGQYALFQNGSIYWSPSTGTRSMQGPIGTFYRQVGAEAGPLGYPTQSVAWLPDHVGQYATFQNGAIYWSPTTGTRTMMGPIGTAYAAAGAERGTLGYPTHSVSWLNDGVGQFALFQRGAIFWSPTTGARVIPGAFWTTYRANDSERGPLGYPTRSPYAVSGGQRMDFQRGTITVSTATGRATVHVN